MPGFQLDRAKVDAFVAGTLDPPGEAMLADLSTQAPLTWTNSQPAKPAERIRPRAAYWPPCLAGSTRRTSRALMPNSTFGCTYLKG